MYKILIVEDEVLARNGIVALIESSGLPCRVVGSAENGYAGMMKTKSYQPDLIITDIKMPRMDGLSMIENIVSWGSPPQFIILTAYAEFSYAQRALQHGVMDYLLKPITADALLETLTRLCARLDARAKRASSNARSADAQAPVPQYPPIVQAMIDYMMESYTRQISLQDVASKLRITPEYASTVFSKATGETFSAYLRGIRLEHAKALLRSTNHKVYEIAYKTGFNDEKYFCRTFKKYVGISAREYAQQQGGVRNPAE